MTGQALFDLTHGWPGLMVAYGSVQAPMWAALARGRASLGRWLASPAVGAAVTLGLGAGSGAGGWGRGAFGPHRGGRLAVPAGVVLGDGEAELF